MRTLRVFAAVVAISAFSAVGATSAQAEVKAPISAAGWQWSGSDAAAGWQWSAPDSAAGWQWSASGWQW